MIALLKPLALKFGPYAVIGILGLLLYASHARVDALKSDLAAKDSICNSRISNGVAEAARVAIRETELAVQAERQRWQELLTNSNNAAIAAEHAREVEAEQARILREQLEALNDEDSKDWRRTPIPDAIRRLQQSAGSD